MHLLKQTCWEPIVPAEHDPDAMRKKDNDHLNLIYINPKIHQPQNTSKTLENAAVQILYHRHTWKVVLPSGEVSSSGGLKFEGLGELRGLSTLVHLCSSLLPLVAAELIGAMARCLEVGNGAGCALQRIVSHQSEIQASFIFTETHF